MFCVRDERLAGWNLPKCGRPNRYARRAVTAEDDSTGEGEPDAVPTRSTRAHRSRRGPARRRLAQE